MARRRANPGADGGETDQQDNPKMQLQLAGGEWQEKIPKPVQEAADEYRAKLKAKNKAAAAFNTARENVLDKMRDAGIRRIRVEDDKGDQKWLTVLDEQKVVLEKITKPTTSDRDQDGD